MSTLVIDRSTEFTSVALVRDDGAVERIDLGIWGGADMPHFRDPSVRRIVVGTGPGSFAGIRSALAFAQGYAVGNACEVLGLTSAAAFARPDEPVAVVGDARRGKFWIALFDGFRLVLDVFQVERDELHSRVPRGVKIFSPDWKRISSVLSDEFGDFASPAPQMDAALLWRSASSSPSLLKPQPLPIYLNPAVRD